MTGLLVAGLLAGMAAALLPPSASRARLHDVLAAPRSGDTFSKARPAGPGPAARSPAMSAAAASCGLGVAALTGGPTGAVLGVAVAVVAFVLLRRLEPAAVRRRRERVAADLPTAVDLLGACLSAGNPPDRALPAVAAAVGGPLAEELAVVTVRLDLGADPVAVWREVGLQAGPLAGLGRTMARALETGAPMADGLRLLATDLRSRRRTLAEQQARSVGVHAAAPLGLCFLPAFVLVGIVPSIASAFAAMSWW